MYTKICLDLCDPKRSHCVNMLAFLIIYSWVYTNIIYRKWIYVIQCGVSKKNISTKEGLNMTFKPQWESQCYLQHRWHKRSYVQDGLVCNKGLQYAHTISYESQTVFKNLEFNSHCLQHQNQIYYKLYCKILNEVLNEAKRLSYSDKLTISHTKVKTTWNIIRLETGKQRENEDNIKSRKINPHTFNKYFLTTAENTTYNIPAQTTDNNRNYECYWDLTHRSPCPKIRFNNITTTKNEKIISSLHPKNSYGYDDILMTILKISTPYISPPLCYIFNKVILTFDVIFQSIWQNTI